MADGTVDIRRLEGAALQEQVDALARVLHDVVDGGGGVSYMPPFGLDDARREMAKFADDVDAGGRLLLAAFLDGELVGTVQLVYAWPPNQPHRADVAKLLVHRSARRRGIARSLMERLEVEARAEGKTVLVLDTSTGGAAEQLYTEMEWNRVGVVPDFAYFPDGRLAPTTFFWKRV